MTSRLNRIGIALNLGLLISIIFVVFSPDAQTSSLLQGDFPAFYSQAVIMAQGKWNEIYNLELQKQIQNQIWPNLNGTFLISPYPPFVALLLAPIGFCSPMHARFIFTLSSSLCLILSFNFLKKQICFLSSAPWLLLALLTTNSFLFVGTLGGQNTAFSLGVITLGFNFLKKSEETHSVSLSIMSGLTFSLWLFKPQFGFLLPIGFAFFRLWNVLIGYALGSICHFLIGALLLGPTWWIDWFKKIAEFSDINYRINGINQASVLGWINSFLFQHYGTLPWISLLTFALLPTLALLVLCYLRYCLKNNLIDSKIFAFWGYLTAIPLIAPQTLFYDIGIIYFCALNCLAVQYKKFSETNHLKVLFALQILGWGLHLSRDYFTYSPFPVISISYLILAICFLIRARETEKIRHF